MNPLATRNSLPNLRHLLAALEVQRLGNITSAANHIHLSQSAVTQGLAKLERELDLSLFERSVNGLYVTEAGEIFLQRAERALTWIKAMEASLPANRAAKNPGNCCACSPLASYAH